MVDANLKKTQLREVNFLKTDLRGAAFDDSFMYKTCFSEANLRNASLKKCFLCSADFMGADLSNASLCGAMLHLAKIRIKPKIECRKRPSKEDRPKPRPKPPVEESSTEEYRYTNCLNAKVDKYTLWIDGKLMTEKKAKRLRLLWVEV